MTDNRPYYANQNSWGMNEYYGLHRYLHRLLLHYDSKRDEIQNMDIGQMSDKTKVLMYCIIRYYNMDHLLEKDNLRQLQDCKPLDEPLVLGYHNLNVPVYNEMNVKL